MTTYTNGRPPEGEASPGTTEPTGTDREPSSEPTARVDIEEPSSPPEETSSSNGKADRTRKSERLLSYAVQEGISLWQTPEGVAYVDMPVSGRLTCAPVESREAEDWLTLLWARRESSTISRDGVAEVQRTLGAMARQPGAQEIPAHIRVAPTPEAVHIDMGGPDWRILQVTAAGWEIVDEMPEGVRFRRPGNAQALPEPSSQAAGGGWAELRRLMGGIEPDSAPFVLCTAWLLGTLTGGPYPVLALTGEQGSGKSTTADILRSTIDPHAVGRRRPPKSDRDIGSAVNNAHVLCFDNLSRIEPWLSDTFAALSTGAAVAARALYTNDSEAAVVGSRPLILTSIPNAVTRDDLADRTLAVDLPQIPPGARVGEITLKRHVKEALPLILGDLLDALSASIRHRSDTPEAGWTRMADFHRTVAAAEIGRALPWPAGTFARVYAEARQGLTDMVLEADPIGEPLLDFMEAHPEWSGTSSELLKALTSLHHGERPPPREWPRSPQAFGGHLRRLRPAFRSHGWEVVEIYENRRRTKRFRRTLVDDPPARDAQELIRNLGSLSGS